TSAWISPPERSNDTPRRACAPANDFAMADAWSRSTSISLVAPTLPCESEPELPVPAIVGRCDRADRQVRDVGVGRTKVIVVEDVEHFRAELGAGAADRKTFAQRQIHLLRPRT